MLETLLGPSLKSPVVLFLGVVIVAVFVLKELFGEPGRKRRKGRPRLKAYDNKNWKKPSWTGEDKLAAATDQLQWVMQADFSARPLLNRPESAVFKALDAAVIERNPRWQVMAQVSLGEFLSSKDKRAYGCVNAKRVDFALMDPDCRVCHAIEYQGNGHHQGSAAARDAVKKEALRKAGIGYHEVVAGHTTPAELRRLVEKLVPPENPVS